METLFFKKGMYSRGKSKRRDSKVVESDFIGLNKTSKLINWIFTFHELQSYLIQGKEGFNIKQRKVLL
jgi:hypothetical protein